MNTEDKTRRKVRITREAFEKMNRYAKFVSEIVGEDIECGGRLLNYYYKEDDVARDIYLSEWQEVTSAEGFLNSGPSLEEMLNEDQKICGMWHSHGGIQPFHSSYDNTHSELLYKTSFMGNKVVTGKKEHKPKIKREKETLHIRLGRDSIKYKDKVITIKGQDGETVNIRIEGTVEEITGEQREEMSIINSIVINKESYLNGIQELGRGYYAEGLIQKTGRLFERQKNLELEIVEEDNGIKKDNETLIKEVGERVKYRGIKLKEHPNYETVLRKYTGLEEKTQERGINEDKLEQQKGYKHKLRKFYETYPTEDETDQAIVNIAKILAGDYKARGKRVWKWEDKTKEAWKQYKSIKKLPKEKVADLGKIYDNVKENSYLKRKHPEKIRKLERMCTGTKYHMGNACIYAGMGMLTVSIVALKGIETVSLNYLNKTRPDVVEMIREGAKFSEITKQYYSKR